MQKNYFRSGFISLLATTAIVIASPAIAQQSGQPSQSKDQNQSQSQQSQNQNRSGQSQMEKESGKTENSQTRQGGQANQSGQTGNQPSQAGASGQSGQSGQGDQTAVLVVVPVEFQRVRAGELIGKDIYGSRGNEIGEIADIVMRTDGQAVAAVADIGGFLGVGEKQVTIPFDELSIQGDRILAKNLTEETADRLESYDRNGWRPFARDRMLGDNR